MRVALLTDESLPNGTRIHAKMIHELAIEFKKKGHKPIVISPGSPKQNSPLVIDYFEEIEIWRFRSGQTRGVGMFRRLVNEFLLPYRAWYAISNEVKNNSFDLCVNYSPTIFFGPLAQKFRKDGTYIYLVLRDMFPQWIIDQGIISKKSPAAFFLRWREKINYDASNCIGVMSKANLKIFKSIFPKYHNVKVLMNWSSVSPSIILEKNFKIREKYNLSEKTIFFYGGNLGHSNDMTNLMRLARSLKHYNDAHFLIIGQGDEYELINDLIVSWDLHNVLLLPSVSQNIFRDILKEIDIGLFTLSKKHTAHNFPGKLLGYMLDSKPILGSVNPGNDLLELINNSEAGYVFINGDDDSLYDAAINLLKNPAHRIILGENGNKLLINKFSVESAAANIMLEMFKK